MLQVLITDIKALLTVLPQILRQSSLMVRKPDLRSRELFCLDTDLTSTLAFQGIAFNTLGGLHHQTDRPTAPASTHGMEFGQSINLSPCNCG